MPAIVGERGPELFVPSVGGRVVAAGQFGSGSFSEINNITDQATPGMDMVRTGREIISAIRQYERVGSTSWRTGGVAQ